MTKSFKAAVLTATGKPLEIHELFVPELQFGQILIQIQYSGICRSQLMESNGGRGVDKWLPHLLGHEGFGTVHDVGSGVTKVREGDEVIISWVRGLGIAAINPEFRSTKGIKVNSGSSTTFSEYSIVSEDHVFLAPKGFNDDLLPLFGCAFLTGGGMVLEILERKVHQGQQQVLVLGFGGVGTSAALILQSYPDINVTIVESSKSRRELANQLGFHEVMSKIDFNAPDKNKFDLCFESAGTSESIELGFNSIKDEGTLVFASHPKSGDLIRLNPYDLIKGKTIKGTWGGGLPPEVMIKEIGERLLKSPADLSLLIGPKFNLARINNGLTYLADGKPGKPLIDFGVLK